MLRYFRYYSYSRNPTGWEFFDPARTCQNLIAVKLLSPSKYVAQAVKNCEQHLIEKLNNSYRLPTKAENPFPMDYCPEMDISDPLDPECSSFYQHLIGVMRWMVELGRVDIATEISLLSSHLAYPRVGHLEVALHLMGYLKQKHNT